MVIDTIGRRGGAERQFCGLALLLKKAGYDVNVVCYYPDDGYQAEMESVGVVVNRLSKSYSQMGKLLKLSKHIHSVNPDVVIAFKGGPCEMCCALKVFGAKWKLLVSERSTTQSLDWHSRLKFFLYRFADNIVPNSFSQADFIKKNYPNLGRKVSVITNFTNTDLFRPSAITANAKPEKSIIVVGRIDPGKNIINFMEAIRRVMDKVGRRFRVDWYGYKTDKVYYEQCVEKAKSLQLENAVFFHDAIATINEEYPKHDTFCLPTFFEGYPNALCEAMACGVPVIVSDVCDNSKIMSAGMNGFLFNPHDIDSMADAIRRILFDLSDDERRAFGKNSRTLAMERFSSEIFTEKYSELIDG